MLVKNCTSQEAYNLINGLEHSVIVDVRTPNEWKEGVISESHKSNFSLILLSWNLSFDLNQSLAFLNELQSKVTDNKTNLFFLCRSGGRSKEAANYIAKNHSYEYCYNIIDGFEGSSSGIGWKNSNLPWKIL